MNDVSSVIKLFLASIRKQGIVIDKAYLFGSHAKGNATSESDIDVCIVSPRFGIDPIAEMTMLRKLAYPVDLRIEPIALSSDDLIDPYSPLVAEINKYGKSIAVS